MGLDHLPWCDIVTVGPNRCGGQDLLNGTAKRQLSTILIWSWKLCRNSVDYYLLVNRYWLCKSITDAIALERWSH